eukprot:TRINITY_DN11634_c0_g1_i1.p1 TRINITY_DN11634_c0_g1~~TRINITY_DN11634_c0_g1_i1.p1  ORF type:complete len:362 (+),score=99.94 TRINITY_DN11634_c0_g1_i1:30-1088(+)
MKTRMLMMMRPLSLVIAFLLMLVCSVVAHDINSVDEENSIDLNILPEEIPESTTVTGSEFKKLHEEINEPILVLFFAPWCGGCQQLLPLWDELEFILTANEDDTPEDLKELLKSQLSAENEEPWKRLIVKVDCSIEANVPVCDEYGVNRFPTIYLFFSQDKYVEFRGERSVDGLLEFVYLTEEHSAERFVPKDPVEIAQIRKESQERSMEARSQVEDAASLEAMGIHVLDSFSDDEIIDKISKGWWLIQLHIGGGYAKDMELTFQKAAAAIKQSYPEVSIGKLNLYRRDELGDRYNVVSFPQVSLFLNGERITYVSGTRSCTFEGITGLVVSHVKSASDYEKLHKLEEEIHS